MKLLLCVVLLSQILGQTCFQLCFPQQFQSYSFVASMSAASGNSQGFPFIYQNMRQMVEVVSKKKDSLLELINVDALKEEESRLQEIVSGCDFWKDETKKSEQTLGQLSEIRSKIGRIDKWQGNIQEAREFLELSRDSLELTNGQMCENETKIQMGILGDLATEIFSKIKTIDDEMKLLETELLLDQTYDNSNCALSITCGAGGIDAQDWTAMLYRMYQRFLTSKRLKWEIIDEITADFGLKGVELSIFGPNAYGLLKSEHGNHRLVRNSPFNSLNKRQTSFAAVSVWPILPENCLSDVVIPDKV